MNKIISDKIRGTITGYVVGGALGIGTQFMRPEEVRLHYPDGLNDYNQIIRDAHRALTDPGDWHEGTMIVTRLIESLTEGGLPMNLTRASGSLTRFFHEGIIDLSPYLRILFSDPDYEAHPVETVQRIWQKMGDATETSDFLGLMIMLGLVHRENVDADAIHLMSIAHCGPRVKGATAVMANLSHALLWEGRVLTPDEVSAIASRYSDDLQTYIDAAREGGEKMVQLLGREHYLDVRHAMAAPLWVLWSDDDFEQGVKRVVHTGGEAETNASITGGLLGLRYGLQAIPQRWLDGVANRDKLRDLALNFVNSLDGIAPRYE